VPHVCKCPGADHDTFGQCCRAKRLHVAYCQSASGRDASKQKQWDKEISMMQDCARQGIVPQNSFEPAIRRALDASDRAGSAFVAGS